MIDPGAALLSYDHACRLVRDMKGDYGLVVVGVGTAGERGFQMLHRFAEISDSLEAHGINIVFVYPKASARHVFDAISIRGARYRGKTCLFLDGDSRLFRKPLPPGAVRAVYLDASMRPLETTSVMLDSETWDEALRRFLANIVGRRLH
ncbi:hypothetical protein K788_0003064 [Paraburkholderia caribensis MBA4]|uniref:Uncharacterized protein n=1 Tax=Paraburkholderia caribensis MBA4 TaxID=1323664 RepID=A0A0P0REJ6_9BURK|nr:hypothetical protein [Paraburkholderia caribensis]ALL66824.1 hypothetical protein K788_0003064 [Paraburkholderia caribensis MBA4]